MKLGQSLFRKDQSIWHKPIIEYDQSKMNELFAEIRETAGIKEEHILRESRKAAISLETELYLLLHS